MQERKVLSEPSQVQEKIPFNKVNGCFLRESNFNIFILASFSPMGSTLKGKNLLHEEQILYLKSRSPFWKARSS